MNKPDCCTPVPLDENNDEYAYQLLSGNKKACNKTELLDALRLGQIRVFGQPLIDLVTDDYFGIELLCRWEHPTRGLLLPADFLPLFTTYNCEFELDLYMLQNAITILEQLSHDHNTDLLISVNIHYSSLSVKLTDNLKCLMNRYPTLAKKIRLEISEVGCVINGSEEHRIMLRIQDFGYSVSLDDFGIGATALTYLSYLSFNEVKLDKSLIYLIFNAKDEEKKRISIMIFETLISWLNSISNVNIVVEGIETDLQLNYIKSLNVNVAQGYIYGKPKPIEYFLNHLLLEKNNAK